MGTVGRHELPAEGGPDVPLTTPLRARSTTSKNLSHTRFLDHTLVQGGESYVVAAFEGIEEVAEQRVLDR